MLVKMSDDKRETAEPTFVVTAPQTSSLKSRLTKKHLVIAAVSLLLVGLAVTAVLVGIHIYNEGQLRALKFKYSMTAKDKDNHDVKQDVSADEESNIVQYHVVKDGAEAWIIEDFDKGIEVSKVETESGVICYVGALNRTRADEPKKIPTTTPSTDENTPREQLVYKVSDEPISDIKFLGKRVSKLCDNIPTHWIEPSCDSGEEYTNTTSPAESDEDRQKRATHCANYYRYGRRYPCICGCCWIVCGRFTSTRYVWRYSRGVYYCTYYMSYVAARGYLRQPYCRFNGRSYRYPWS